MSQRNHNVSSVKDCAECGKQGRCYDSRHGDKYVRRLYRCECGNKWSTVELLVGDNSTDPWKIRKFLKSKGLDMAVKSAGIRRAIATLEELL